MELWISFTLNLSVKNSNFRIITVSRSINRASHAWIERSIRQSFQKPIVFEYQIIYFKFRKYTVTKTAYFSRIYRPKIVNTEHYMTLILSKHRSPHFRHTSTISPMVGNYWHGIHTNFIKMFIDLLKVNRHRNMKIREFTELEEHFGVPKGRTVSSNTISARLVNVSQIIIRPKYACTNSIFQQKPEFNLCV